jgi:3-deoxy-D-manno-octulosonic-acid transferase
MGPHYENFRAITVGLLAADAVRIAQAKDLAAALIHLLSNPREADAMGARARHVFEQQAGATARCVEAISELLKEREP